MLLRRGITPLTTFSPLVLDQQHRFRRRRTHAVASNAAARASFVEASFAEDTWQRYEELLVHGEVTAQQPNLPVLTLVPVHRAVTAILLVVARRLTRTLVTLIAGAADRLTIVRVPLTSVILSIGTASGLLCALRYQGFSGAE